MWLNIALVSVLFAFFGSIANTIMGGSGGYLHNAFIGFLGYALCDILRRTFNLHFLGLLGDIVITLICSCFVIWALREFRYRYSNPGSGQQ